MLERKTMSRKYLIKIYTKTLLTNFKIEVEKEINTLEELHPHIIDFLGKSDINWERNHMEYASTGNDFYITYEEVNDGSGQHGIVRKETEARV
jgi:hypothetical protein|tara:strand:- start:301 stop:579 length:279 start_codon:yes stop_codon:yes gene_type:complete